LFGSSGGVGICVHTISGEYIYTVSRMKVVHGGQFSECKVQCLYIVPAWCKRLHSDKEYPTSSVRKPGGKACVSSKCIRKQRFGIDRREEALLWNLVRKTRSRSWSSNQVHSNIGTERSNEKAGS